MMRRCNQRRQMIILLGLAGLFLLGVTIAGIALRDMASVSDLSQKNLPPSLRHPFGTDWMGRDMLIRTICGLSMSIRLGLLTAAASALLALLFGTLAAVGGKAADTFVTWLIDLMMGIPHLLLLILVCFACGNGVAGVVIGITISHWMSLARLIRAEILQLRESGYIKASMMLGVRGFRPFRSHILPHLLPQFFVGLTLLFPHAILHEASITFLGFGLSPEQPAIGVILSESMQYLMTGSWWLALFPGMLLLVTVMLFDFGGNCIKKLTDPVTYQE